MPATATQVKCTVEPTKNNSPKWRWLAPVDAKSAPIGQIPIKADAVNGRKTVTVTLDL